MQAPNLINLHDRIAELERKKWSCDWDTLQVIQSKITAYREKISNGINFEPAF